MTSALQGIHRIGLKEDSIITLLSGLKLNYFRLHEWHLADVIPTEWRQKLFTPVCSNRGIHIHFHHGRHSALLTMSIATNVGFIK